MSAAQISRPAPRTDAVAVAVAGHAYCIPVVRELPLPVADPGGRGW